MPLVKGSIVRQGMSIPLAWLISVGLRDPATTATIAYHPRNLKDTVDYMYPDPCKGTFPKHYESGMNKETKTALVYGKIAAKKAPAPCFNREEPLPKPMHKILGGQGRMYLKYGKSYIAHQNLRI